MILAQWPNYEQDEIQAAMAVLESGRVNYWTGEHGKLFEKEFAAYCGAEFGVALANGSVGLDVALRAIGIGPGDEVIVSPRSFFASAACIALTGATPVFADVDLRSQNISVESIEACLSSRTKAIICVHLYGWPCDMPAIMELASSHNLKVIEDCAQAHGAKIAGRSVGSWGDIGVFSFCQDKIMSTGGEGGMLVTSNEDYWLRSWSMKDHGKNYRKVYADDHPPGFRWLHDSFGSNYRMTEMQAAIGRLQLKKLDSWVARRQENAAAIEEVFDGLSAVRIEKPPEDISHAYYKYGFFLRREYLASGRSQLNVLQEFGAAGIPAFTGSCPEIYLEEAFSGGKTKSQDRLPNARTLGETSLVLLVHPTIDKKNIHRIAVMAAEILDR